MKIAVNKKISIACFVLLIFSNISYAATQGAASVFVSAPRNFDIVGMKLGMTVSEMEAAITKHNSRINISKKPGAKKTYEGAPLGDYVFTMRGAREPMEKIDIVFFTPPDSNVASSIDDR